MTSVSQRSLAGTALESLEGLEASVSGADKIIDLKGAKVTLDDVILNVTDHSYVIRNGTLEYGTIKVGPPTTARRVRFVRVNLHDVEIECVEELHADIEFVECFGVNKCRVKGERVRFTRCKMLENVELQARRLELEDCWGLRYDHAAPLVVSDEVRIHSSGENPRAKLKNVNFKGTGGRLILDHTVTRGSEITGNFDRVEVRQSEMRNCRLYPSAGSWREESVLHTSDNRRNGRWDPLINNTLELHDVTFETVTVDTATLANFCEDLRTVDIQNAHVDSEWEVLRDNYSGTLLAFHLLFLVAFVAPLATKLVVYAGMAGAQFNAVGMGMQEWDYEVVWRILLFGLYEQHTWVGWLHAALTVALLVYNIGRVYLTVTIVKLRAREEHLAVQRFRKARPADHKYRLKYFVHKLLMKPLFYLALASALWKVWDAVSLQIPVPPM